ncbi:hypothetical protein APZ24_gp018 [Ostreococcus lucimarinus virus 2]|uniref:hypothetical protein n=1 Tax=Ostreococcus lucimarinus virus 2 TaxID=1663208 RepID=UPI0006D13D2B|nr:hypothetical protein APZ24_gp018 [Ostreococcus lucimarinus virus 2]ALI95381.1 hypothetical protein OlV2_018c [Ostreococcus lucimarinus virus 2]
MSMYKRPPLRVREEPGISTRPKPGSFLDKIVNPPPSAGYKQKRYPVYQKDTYLALLKRNYHALGLEYKEPDIPDYVPPVKSERPSEPELTFADKVYMKVRILKSGIIRIKLDTSFAVLYEKYYSNQKHPPMKSIIQAYKSLGFSSEFLEKVKTKFSKFADHKKKVQEKIDSIFNKEPVKKPKKTKKKEELIEDENEEIEEERDDEEEEDDDPGEDGEMDVELDEDPDEQPQDDQDEAYISD